MSQLGLSADRSTAAESKRGRPAIVTDLHFGARNDAVQFIDFFEKFYKDVFFPALDAEGTKTVFIPGDIFDRRKYINFYSLYRARKMFFDELANRGIQVYCFVGNHDTTFKNTNEVNSLDLLLDGYENIHVVPDPSVYFVEGTPVILVPWICAENVEAAHELIRNGHQNAKIVFGHFEIRGFEMYKGQVNHDGYEADMFQAYDLVMSGHFHHRSKVGNVQYLGNPYEITWADYNDPRGFHFIDLKNAELEFVENPHTIFDRIIYNDDGRTMEDFLDLDYSQWTGKIIKVLVQAKTNPYWFDVFIDRLDKAGPLSVNVVEEGISVSSVDDRELVEQVDDVATFLSKYIDQYCDGVDKSKLSKLAQELLVEAQAADWRQ